MGRQATKKQQPDNVKRTACADCNLCQVGGGTFLTLQRYFRLEDGRRWQPVTDVQHSHMATPLSVLSVSQGKVYVVKANIAVNLEKSMLMVQEGHVFDSVKGTCALYSLK